MSLPIVEKNYLFDKDTEYIGNKWQILVVFCSRHVNDRLAFFLQK